MQWLEPLDAAMMTAEVLDRPLNIGAVLILSPPAEAGSGYIDELHRDALSGRQAPDPRLRRYPHRGIETGGGWVWREADSVELSHHCQRRSLGPDGRLTDLWRLISGLHAEPLDRSRPLWESYIIDGLDDGRFALYLKAHHTLVDGMAGLQLIGDALSCEPTRRSMPHLYASRPQGREEPQGQTRRENLAVRTPGAMFRSLLGTGAAGVALAGRVVTGEVSDVVASLFGDTTVAPLTAPYTRFNGRLGRQLGVTGATWPKARIRTVKEQAGVTGNDVVTAVVAGVLRHWLLDRNELPRQSLVAICPITVRSREHPSLEHNNMFGAWLCPLGTNLADPLERLDLIHRSMSVGKHRVATRGAGISMLLLAGAIGPTVLLPMLPLAPRLRTGYNLPISHVAGPPTEMYWNGAHVEDIYPVSAVYAGQALNVTTCSYADRIGFGYVAGCDALPNIDSLISMTEQSLTELEVAVGLASSGSRSHGGPMST